MNKFQRIVLLSGAVLCGGLVFFNDRDPRLNTWLIGTCLVTGLVFSALIGWGKNRN